jgi:hypothetical protein
MRAAGMRGSRPALDTMPLADFRILPPKDNCATEPRDIYQMYGVERITCRPRIARRRPRLRAAWQRGRRRSHTCSAEQSSPPFISLAVFLCKILTLPDDSPRSSASPCTGCEFCSSASPREVGGENARVCGQSTSSHPEGWPWVTNRISPQPIRTRITLLFAIRPLLCPALSPILSLLRSH